VFVDVSNIRYPKLDSIMNLKPNPYILLGKELVFECKYDGSNLRIYLDQEGKLVVGSRNMDIASEQFQEYFASTSQHDAVEDLLRDAEQWNDTYVVIGELLIKGKSPTKIEYHDDHSFVLFDIWSVKEGGFVNYTKKYQEAYHHGVPIAELWGTCNVNTLESLLEFRDKMLQKSLDEHREGVVGKYVNKENFIYFKEKNDIPRYTKVPRAEEFGKIVLPPLADSELCGAIEKVYVDIGTDFFDVSKAMPLVAKYVNIEQQKHNCAPPERKLFEAYKSRVEELRLSGGD
jgi:hypothetical protein